MKASILVWILILCRYTSATLLFVFLFAMQEQEVDVKKRVDEMGRLLTAGGKEKREKDAAS